MLPLTPRVLLPLVTLKKITVLKFAGAFSLFFTAEAQRLFGAKAATRAAAEAVR